MTAFLVFLYFVFGAFKCYQDFPNIVCAIDEVVSDGKVQPIYETWYWFAIIFFLETTFWPYFLWMKYNGKFKSRKLFDADRI